MTRTPRTTPLPRVLATALALTASAGAAQDAEPAAGQRVWLQLAAFRPDIDSTLRLDRAGGALQGTRLDGESDLGLARHRTQPAALLGVRLGERWRAEFEYLRMSRSARSGTGPGGIAFGDAVFQAEVDAAMRSETYRLSLGYSALRTPVSELGLVVGAHLTDMMVRLRGSASVNGQPVAGFTERRRETLPAPTVGLYGSHRLGARWELDGRVDFFKLSHDGYRGRIVNAQANALYHATRNIAVGLGWRHEYLRVDADRSSFNGTLRQRWSGPQAFVRVGF